jgi:penicillin-binding protein 1A
MAMIAGLPKAPSRFNPWPTRRAAKSVATGSWGACTSWARSTRPTTNRVAEPLNASYHVPTPEVNAPYIAEMARAEMVGRYGSDAYTEGFRVTTTVPSDLQEIANTACIPA